MVMPSSLIGSLSLGGTFESNNFVILKCFLKLQFGHSSSAPPPLRGTPVPLPPPPPPPAPSVVSVNREARLPLEERLRLVLGCGEASSNLNSGRAFAPTGPPSLPPPPPPPLGNSGLFYTRLPFLILEGLHIMS